MTIGSTGSSMAVSGLVSGINTQQVITALLQSYQIPINDLQNRQTAVRGQSSDYQTISADMLAVLNASQALTTAGAWNLMAATSSNPSVATAVTSPGATAGSLAFTVNALAQGNVLASQGSATSESQVVTSAPSFLVATGGAALGLSALGASGSLALGPHTLTVTQSSQAATVAGTSAPAASTTVTTGTNDVLDVSVGGTAYSLTLAAGTYTPGQLAAAVGAAATAAGAPLTASLDSLGRVQLSSDLQGSSSSIAVTGGDALGSLGLAAGQTATGVDAVVSVDGTQTTLSSVAAGQQVTLGAPSGSIVATVGAAPGSGGSLVTAGTAAASLVSSGDGSLGQVVANINAAGLGATASAVRLPTGNYLLQVAATQTGLAGSVSLDPAAFSGSPLGSMSTITAAQDASITVGGSGGYSLTSATNTFTNLLQGTTVTVTSPGQAAVTVQADATGESAKVGALVGAANQALSDIKSLAGYDAATKTAGPLMGSAVLMSLQQQILATFGSAAGTSGLGNAAAAGITLNADGTISFDQATFQAAFSANPTAVRSLFTQDATFSPLSPANAGQVSLAYAGNQTPAGSYDVTVTRSASQATDPGAALAGGSVSAAETLTFTQGGASAAYATTAGESLTAIATGLDQAFAAQGLTLTAAVVGNGTQLQVTTTGYGSLQSFQVASSAPGTGTTGLGGAAAGTPASFAGTDVAGTIGGQAATGSGQVLSASATGPLAGLAVLVTAPGLTSSTDLGSLAYVPGLAQQLATVADSATNALTGSLTATIQGLTAQANGYNSGIAMYQQLESSQQTVLQNEFATMEATLGTLKNESAMLTSQINQLP